MNTFGSTKKQFLLNINMLKKSTPASGQRLWLKITLLFTGSMTVLAGAGITAAIPEIQLHFEGLPHAELLSKLILTIPALMIALLAPVAGQIIDRTGRKIPLLVSLLLYATAGTSGFYLQNIYAILAGRALLGVAVAGIMTVNTTLIGDYFQGISRSKFMGWQGAFMAFGGVVFVAAGGFLADYSWRMPFLVYSFSLIILLLAVVFIYEPEITSGKSKVHINVKQQRKFSKYILVYSTAFMGMLFFYVIPTQIPFLLHQGGNLSNSSIGYSISTAILAGAFASMQYGKIRLRYNFYQIYALTFALMGAGYFVVSLSGSYIFMMAGLIIAGFGTGLLMPNTNLWLISLAPVERRGRMVGLLNFSVYSGQFLSPVFLFPLIEWKSIGFAIGVCGVVMLMLAAWFLFKK
jgi:MFS family permease